MEAIYRQVGKVRTHYHKIEKAPNNKHYIHYGITADNSFGKRYAVGFDSFEEAEGTLRKRCPGCRRI